MNPTFFPDRRAPALLAVLLIHLLVAGLLLREVRRPATQPAQHRLLLRVLPTPSQPPRPRTAAPRQPAAPPLELPRPAAPNAITLPTLPAEVGAGPVAAEAAASAASAAPAPLNLRLPTRMGTAPPPSLAEQIRADARANSPRESAAERMASALGAKGWTVLDLGDGGRKVTGPFGECQIIRPSMVDGIPGHPHAGLLPPRVFSCGGIEKGSLKHERPK